MRIKTVKYQLSHLPLVRYIWGISHHTSAGEHSSVTVKLMPVCLLLVSEVLLPLQVMWESVDLWHQNHFHGKVHLYLMRVRTVLSLPLPFMGHTLKSKQVSRHLVPLAIQVRRDYASKYVNHLKELGSVCSMWCIWHVCSVIVYRY